MMESDEAGSTNDSVAALNVGRARHSFADRLFRQILGL
jgi:hypothetical protein